MRNSTHDAGAGPGGDGLGSSPETGSDARRRWGRGTAAAALAVGLIGGGVLAVPAQAINSNPPTGPGNVEIFPVRDMVAIEGYAEQAGKTATFTVRRAAARSSAARRAPSDASGFLEVNHPGGVCWGAGTDLKVTPDIEAGDEVRVDFSDGSWDGSEVVDVEATGVVTNATNHSLTINGRYGPGVDMPGTDLVADPGKFGIEIVNPDMRNGSAIGERAIGWPDGRGAHRPHRHRQRHGHRCHWRHLQRDLRLPERRRPRAGQRRPIAALGWLAEPDPALGVEAQFGLYAATSSTRRAAPAWAAARPARRRPAPTARRATAPRVPVRAASPWTGRPPRPTPGAPAVDGYTVRAVTLDGSGRDRQAPAEHRRGQGDGHPDRSRRRGRLQRRDRGEERGR